MLFKVIGSDNNVYGLVSTKVNADAIVDMHKLSKSGARAPTKCSSLTFRVEQVEDSEHPGFKGKR